MIPMAQQHESLNIFAELEKDERLKALMDNFGRALPVGIQNQLHQLAQRGYEIKQHLYTTDYISAHKEEITDSKTKIVQNHTLYPRQSYFIERRQRYITCPEYDDTVSTLEYLPISPNTLPTDTTPSIRISKRKHQIKKSLLGIKSVEYRVEMQTKNSQNSARILYDSKGLFQEMVLLGNTVDPIRKDIECYYTVQNNRGALSCAVRQGTSLGELNESLCPIVKDGILFDKQNRVLTAHFLPNQDLFVNLWYANKQDRQYMGVNVPFEINTKAFDARTTDTAPQNTTNPLIGVFRGGLSIPRKNVLFQVRD